MRFKLTLQHDVPEPENGLNVARVFITDAHYLIEDAKQKAKLLANEILAALPFVGLELWHIASNRRLGLDDKFEAVLMDEKVTIKIHSLVGPTKDKPNGLINYNYGISNAVPSWQAVQPHVVGCEWRKKDYENI